MKLYYIFQGVINLRGASSFHLKSLLKFASFLCIFISVNMVYVPVLLAYEKKSAEKDTDLETREYMIEISRHLGVTCTECHDTKNFKSDKLPNFGVAKQHIKLVNLLNQNGFASKNHVKADCFMCHRGSLNPDYKEKLGLGAEKYEKLLEKENIKKVVKKKEKAAEEAPANEEHH